MREDALEEPLALAVQRVPRGRGRLLEAREEQRLDRAQRKVLWPSHPRPWEKDHKDARLLKSGAQEKRHSMMNRRLALKTRAFLLCGGGPGGERKKKKTPQTRRAHRSAWTVRASPTPTQAAAAGKASVPSQVDASPADEADAPPV